MINEYQNPFFFVTKEKYRERNFYIVNKAPAVIIFAYDSDGIYFIKQFRPAIKTWGWELPAGGTDGQDPLFAAKRELKEETGLIADKWSKIGMMHIAPGLSTNVTYIFTAENLTQTGVNEQEEEGIVDCKKFSIEEIKRMIDSEEIHDAPTISALARILL